MFKLKTAFNYLIILLLLINFSSCSNDTEVKPEIEANATLTLAVQNDATLWNTVSIDYTLDVSNFEPTINLLVDGLVVSTHNNGDIISLNTKNYQDGIHEITLIVLDNDKEVETASIEVSFLNTLAIINFGEFIVNPGKGYVLIDFLGETVTFEPIINNSIVKILRPNNFNESHFNITYITGINQSYYYFRSIKNINYWEETLPTEISSSNGNIVNFEFTNLPTTYNYFNVSGPYASGFGPINGTSISLESTYTQNVTANNKDFYLYISKENNDKYFYIEDLNAFENNTIFNFEEASSQMDAYSYTLSNPISSLNIGIHGPSENYKVVYSNLYSNPKMSLEFNLPRLNDLNNYDTFSIHQVLHINEKNLHIYDLNNEIRFKSAIDLDFTYTNTGLGQMNLNITNDFDETSYMVYYQRADFTNLSWSVSYKDYNNDHTFPVIPEQIIPDFDNFLSSFNYLGSKVSVSKTDNEGTKFILED